MAKDTVTVDQYAIPDAKTLQEARDLSVVDEKGNKITFGELTKPQEDTPRQLVVFIRHFFCGHCEDYVRALTKDLSPKTLAAANPPTHLTIIGCGQPSVIADYKTRTECPYPIYSDPERRLYDKLEMVVTLDLGPTKPDYLKSNILTGSVNSIISIFKSGPKKGLSGGKFNQNGGEWIFDESGNVTWCRRMLNTRDHSEIPELQKALGLKEN